MGKAYAPMCIITSLSFCPYALDEVTMNQDRMTIAAALLLSNVALSFSLSEKLPDVPYMTLFDNYTLVSVAVIAANMAVMAISEIIRRENDDPDAQPLVEQVLVSFVAIGWFLWNLLYIRKLTTLKYLENGKSAWRRQKAVRAVQKRKEEEQIRVLGETKYEEYQVKYWSKREIEHMTDGKGKCTITTMWKEEARDLFEEMSKAESEADWTLEQTPMFTTSYWSEFGATAQTVAQYEEEATEEDAAAGPRAIGEPSAAPIHGQDLGAAVEEQQL